MPQPSSSSQTESLNANNNNPTYTSTSTSNSICTPQPYSISDTISDTSTFTITRSTSPFDPRIIQILVGGSYQSNTRSYGRYNQTRVNNATSDRRGLYERQDRQGRFTSSSCQTGDDSGIDGLNGDDRYTNDGDLNRDEADEEDEGQDEEQEHDSFIIDDIQRWSDSRATAARTPAYPEDHIEPPVTAATSTPFPRPSAIPVAPSSEEIVHQLRRYLDTAHPPTQPTFVSSSTAGTQGHNYDQPPSQPVQYDADNIRKSTAKLLDIVGDIVSQSSTTNTSNHYTHTYTHTVASTSAPPPQSQQQHQPSALVDNTLTSPQLEQLERISREIEALKALEREAVELMQSPSKVGTRARAAVIVSADDDMREERKTTVGADYELGKTVDSLDVFKLATSTTLFGSNTAASEGKTLPPTGLSYSGVASRPRYVWEGLLELEDDDDGECSSYHRAPATADQLHPPTARALSTATGPAEEADEARAARERETASQVLKYRNELLRYNHFPLLLLHILHDILICHIFINIYSHTFV